MEKYEKECIYVCICVCVCVLSHIRHFVTPWTVDHQPPLSIRFSRQEYWSGLPFSPPGDLPNPGNEPKSPASPILAGGFFITELPGLIIYVIFIYICHIVEINTIF